MSAQRRAEIAFEAEKLNASMQVYLLRHRIIYLTSVHSTFAIENTCVVYYFHSRQYEEMKALKQVLVVYLFYVDLI